MPEHQLGPKRARKETDTPKSRYNTNLRIPIVEQITSKDKRLLQHWKLPIVSHLWEKSRIYHAAHSEVFYFRPNEQDLYGKETVRRG